MPQPSVILIDIGGNARLDNVALQLRLCLRAFRPRLILIRSSELAQVVSLIGQIETPEASIPTIQNMGSGGRDHLDNLLDLSSSSSVDCRVFAAQQLWKYDDPIAVNRLQALLSDHKPSVRRAAKRALSVRKNRETPSA